MNAEVGDDWPTRVEMESLSMAERKLEAMDDSEESASLRTDIIAKIIVVVVPISVVTVVLAIICGVRACRKAATLQKMKNRIRELDAEGYQFVLRLVITWIS